MLSQRVDPTTWAKIKAYMRYYDEDLIEEMDWFGTQPGWHVTNEAEVERILGIPEEWHVVPRRVKAKQEEAERKEQKIREEQESRARIARKKSGYVAWQEQTLAGLERFHAWFEDFPQLEWVEVASFDKEAGWHDTGDRWGKAIWNGDVIYKRSYGNTTSYYTTRSNAVMLARLAIAGWKKYYPTDVEIARQVLVKHDNDCIGDDPARIIVEEDGLQHFIDIAKQEPWYLIARGSKDEDIETAQKYGLPYVLLSRGKSIYSRDVSRTTQETFKQRIDKHFGTRYTRHSAVYYLPDGGKWFVSEGHSSAHAVPAPDLADLFPELMREVHHA